jgi:fatty acid amide hydrolase
MLVNLLGLPAGVVAATRVRPNEQSNRPASFDLAERAARQVEQDSAGLPIGVQVAAAHWHEDIVLAVMRRLEAHFRQQADYPARPPI